MATIQISRLFLYPIKSCAGLPVSQATLIETGFQYDRLWMVTDEKYKFVTQIKEGRLALVTPKIIGIPALQCGLHLEGTVGMEELESGDTTTPQLILTIPATPTTDEAPEATSLTTPATTTTTTTSSMILPLHPTEVELAGLKKVQVHVWGDDTPAYDEGDEVADWLSTFLGRRVRLVRYILDQGKRATKTCPPTAEQVQQALASPEDDNDSGSSNRDPAATTLPPRPVGGWRSIFSYFAPSSASHSTTTPPPPQWPGRVMFSNDSPILLASEASLVDVNQHLPTPIDIRRFRPNIMVDGIAPFEEDTWHRISIKAGALARKITPPISSSEEKITVDADTNASTSAPSAVTLMVTSRCTRCPMTNNNPDTGIASLEHQPLKTLVNYRRVDPGDKYRGCFGMNCVPVRTGKYCS
ncbi:hypothetical protein H4R33_000540 [Dimargaris cristalligena]|uniref:MOSC N-terminal beta barrel domain-containing protein n=1 Tax=Dimargaris cristalligena TaxID=215637 RepID=A0A4Q0A3C2_9FUNG|nr:hypothetical protein H4R33_000540 [Dimargaris cristalligena]RKP39760.1 MOSC N-terminal beta barrel domain-containing protein [Dimargaris cristalligena]|eukprot:RKP39760.1 MOSC N-terminal beta barrel domain-containing protein [Dimargaris cristalligena]